MKRYEFYILAFIIVAVTAAGSYYLTHKTQLPAPVIAAPAAKAPAATAPTANAPATNAVAANTAEAASDEDNQVEIPVEKQQLIGVKVVKASRTDFAHTVRTVGRIEYDEARLATVTTKVEGWLERLHANSTGMYIKKGDAVAELYSPELIATEREYLSALKWADEANSKNDESLKADAGRMVGAARQRLALWDITEADIDRLAKDRTPKRTFSVTSPVSGVV